MKYKVNRAARLLAESALDEEMKKAVLENIGKATEADLDNLLDSLEREKVAMEKIARELGEYEVGEDERWKKLEEQQKDIAQKLADDFLAGILEGQLRKE